MATLHLPTRRDALLGAGALFAWAYAPKLARAEGRDPRLLVVVLRGENHIVDARWFAIFVLNRHLDLAIRPQVAECLGAADVRELSRQPVSEGDRQRHELGRLIARESEHHPGVTRASDVDPLRDVGGLFPDDIEHPAARTVESHVGGVIADIQHGLSDQGFDIHPRAGRDLTGHDDDAGFDQGFAGHAAARIGSQDGIEHGIRNLVRNLVRMAF